MFMAAFWAALGVLAALSIGPALIAFARFLFEGVVWAIIIGAIVYAFWCRKQ